MYTDYFSRACACIAFAYILIDDEPVFLPLFVVVFYSVFFMAIGLVNAFLWCKHTPLLRSPYMGGE